MYIHRERGRARGGVELEGRVSFLVAIVGSCKQHTEKLMAQIGMGISRRKPLNWSRFERSWALTITNEHRKQRAENACITGVDTVQDDMARAVPGIHQANKKVHAGSSSLFNVLSNRNPRRESTRSPTNIANETIPQATMKPPRPQQCFTFEHKSNMFPMTIALDIESVPYTAILNNLIVNMSS
jgi:hypothetical protein